MTREADINALNEVVQLVLEEGMDGLGAAVPAPTSRRLEKTGPSRSLAPVASRLRRPTTGPSERVLVDTSLGLGASGEELLDWRVIL